MSGLFSSTSETKEETELADLSARGVSYEQAYLTLYQAQLDQAGYDMSFDYKTTYKEPEKATGLQNQIDGIDKQIADAQARLDKTRTEGGPAGAYNQSAANAQQRIDQLQAQRDQLSAQLANLDQETYPDIKVNKREDVRVTQAIEKFGETSPEVAQMRQQIKDEKVYEAETSADIKKQFMESTKKFVSGDMSYTDEDKAQVDKYFEPVKEVLLNSYNEMLTTYADNKNALSAEFDKVADLIDKTGFDVESALQAAEVQIGKSGDRLVDVLAKATASQEAKASFEFGLMSEQADTYAAQQSALLGLPPGSMAEKVMSEKIKADALTSIRLNLAESQTSKELMIRGEEESGKKNISLARVQLAEQQGGKKLGLAQAKINLLGDYASKAENVVAAKNEALFGLEQTRQQQLLNKAYGNIPSMLNVGASGLQFGTGQMAGNIGLTGSLMAPAGQQLGVQQQGQFAEATRTSTTKSTPSFFDVATDVAGVATGMKGAGFFGGSSYSNSGGVPPIQSNAGALSLNLGASRT